MSSVDSLLLVWDIFISRYSLDCRKTAYTYYMYIRTLSNMHRKTLPSTQTIHNSVFSVPPNPPPSLPHTTWTLCIMRWVYHKDLHRSACNYKVWGMVTFSLTGKWIPFPTSNTFVGVDIANEIYSMQPSILLSPQRKVLQLWRWVMDLY